MRTGLPALPPSVLDLIEEFEEKNAEVEATIAAYDRAYTDLQMASTVMGAFVEPIGEKSYLYADRIRRNLLRSGWTAIYNRLQIDRVASVNDKQLFEKTLANPPELTFETARATFGDYLERPRFHILRGLAEVFADLDPAFKSHSKVRIGVKALPKRVILKNYSGYGWQDKRFQQIANAIAMLQGIPFMEWPEVQAVEMAYRAGEDAVFDGRIYSETDRYNRTEEKVTLNRGLTVRRYMNGNAHVYFSKETLLDVNRALAEFYGEVLPDAEPEGVKQSASTAVAKDLQFYWTPRKVIEAALDFAGIVHPDHYRGEAPSPLVLEPSCGDGRMLDVLREYGTRPLGIEYHPGRAAEANAKGHAVITGNFLERHPVAEFDYVVMNPPFCGRHYVKHVKHALKFVKPGGTLVAILPATAHYDHAELEGQWRDLPVGSFSEVGTNVPTGMLRVRVKA